MVWCTVYVFFMDSVVIDHENSRTEWKLVEHVFSPPITLSSCELADPSGFTFRANKTGNGKRPTARDRRHLPAWFQYQIYVP